MSERNGDRARFAKSLKRKRQHREQIRMLVTALAVSAPDDGSGPPRRRVTARSADPATKAASLAMQNEGGLTRTGA